MLTQPTIPDEIGAKLKAELTRLQSVQKEDSAASLQGAKAREVMRPPLRDVRKMGGMDLEVRHCARCGKRIEKKPYEYMYPPERTYCSLSCASLSRTERDRKAKEEQKQLVQSRQQERVENARAAREKKQRALNPDWGVKETRPCVTCGKPVTRTKAGFRGIAPERTHCSPSCHAKHLVQEGKFGGGMPNIRDYAIIGAKASAEARKDRGEQTPTREVVISPKENRLEEAIGDIVAEVAHSVVQGGGFSVEQPHPVQTVQIVVRIEVVGDGITLRSA